MTSSNLSVNMRANIHNALIFLLFTSLVACSAEQTITFQTRSAPVTIIIETAKTADQQTRGLMFRDHLDENHGMLFVFSHEKPRSFWMKNTRIPLDIIFISKDKKVVDIKEQFRPCKNDPCESYTSSPAAFALEVNAGFTRTRGITIGTTVTLQ